jgi:hypothetical protein
LANADSLLAEILIEDARVNGVSEAKLAGAVQKWKQGQNQQDQNNYDEAIDFYGDAWKLAGKVIFP